jgi:hypothetical protein
MVQDAEVGVHLYSFVYLAQCKLHPILSRKHPRVMLPDIRALRVLSACGFKELYLAVKGPYSIDNVV